jgi:outer membrane protein assembly factor BamE (lipoprotein component of BamABCDE complex)
MRVRPATAIILAACFLASACITVGQAFRPDAVQLVELNVTTRDQVRAALGPPWRTGIEDGLDTWTYGHYRYSMFGASRTRDLVVKFDEAGVVVSYQYNTTTPGP